MVKDIKKMAEESKVSVRNIRRDGMEKVKADLKNGDITEDERTKLEDDVQKLTDKFIAEIDKMLENKEKEIMNI